MAGLIGFIHKIANLLGLGRKHSAKTQHKSQTTQPSLSSQTSLSAQLQPSQSSPSVPSPKPQLSDSERLQNLIKRDMRQLQIDAAAAATSKKQRRKRKSESTEDLIPPAVALPLSVSQLDRSRIEDIMNSAQIYELGQDCPQDLKSAFLCYLSAAQRNYLPAKYKLAKIYEQGISAHLKPNYKQALFWMHQAAKQGLPEAMLDFAHYFKDGHMIAQDHALYVFWLTKAAQNGLIPAQQELSHLYLVGDIVEQDFDKAAEWLEISEQQALSNAEQTANFSDLPVYKLEYAAGVTSQLTEDGGLHDQLIVDKADSDSEVVAEAKDEADETDIDAALDIVSDADYEAGNKPDKLRHRGKLERNLDNHSLDNLSLDNIPEPLVPAAAVTSVEVTEIESILAQSLYHSNQHDSLDASDTADSNTYATNVGEDYSKLTSGFNYTADAAMLYQLPLDAYHSAFMQQSLPLSFMARPSNTRFFVSDMELNDLSFSPQLQPLLKQAQQGDIEAQLALAHKYLEGDGDELKPNLTQAVTWLVQAVNGGSQQALWLLGQLCFKQAALWEDHAQLYALLSFAAQNHYVPAQFKLGLMYLTGRYLTEVELTDPQFVLDLAEQATEPTFEPDEAEPNNRDNENNGNKEAASAVELKAGGAGAVNENVPHGNTGVVENHTVEATVGLVQSAQPSQSPRLLQPDGTNSLDRSEHSDLSAMPVLVKDVAQAVYWLEHAAQQGLLPALTVLGMLYSRGTYCNRQRSLHCLQRAALFSKPNPFTTAAQLKLGQYFERGWGVAVDYAQALHWYEQAQAAGSVPALVRLGWMYYHGYGVAQSFTQASELFAQAAQSKDCTGQYALGLMYKHGYSVAQDHAQALALFKQAAAVHEKHALYELGQAYDLGQGVRVDNVMAWRYLEESAYLGCVRAQYALGCKYRDGKQLTSDGTNSLQHHVAVPVGVPDLPRALFWFTRAAQHGSAPAQYALGSIYLSRLGGEIDYAQARQWLTQAVNQHYLAANISLGHLYEQGLGVAPDPHYAQELYTQAYQQGYRGGLTSLGWNYQHGLGVKPDIQEAIRLYEQAAAQGDASALNNLGWLYQKGIGLPADPDKAAELYQRAVNLNHLSAINNLAWLYQKGLGVKKDYAQALRLYRIAAERNYPNAKVSLGWMYEHGLGVTADPQQAYEYYQQAANQNLPNALFYMGRCYERGIGVKVDLSIAQDWYSKASSLGNLKASKALERLMWQRQQGRYGGF